MVLLQQLLRKIEERRRGQTIRIVSLLLGNQRVASKYRGNEVDVLIVFVGEAEEEYYFKARVLGEVMHTPGGPDPPLAQGIDTSLG